MTIFLRQKPLPQVVRQIVQRDNGAWFDPEDLSTMFQDAAGTIPVTALEQPVGKWLDKSGNGNHATQSVTASRPVISARYNLLTNTEDFANSVWLLNTLTITSNSILSPFGDLSADTVTKTADPGGIFQIIPVTPSSVYTFSCYVKSGSFDISNHRFAFYNETAQSFIASDVIPTYVNSNAGWLLGIATVNIPAGCTSLRVYPFRSTLSLAGSLYLFGAQLNVGTTKLPYQRVNTATDYDTAGFPKYIKAEGVDDHFVLPYLGLYNNASCSIITSHSSSSQAANGVIVSEASSTDADTKYLPYRQLASAGNVDSYIAADNAAVILDSTGAAYSGTKENIIESIIDSGTSIETYRSGVLLSNEPYTRSATLTLNNTTLFGSVSTTNTDFLNTKLYGLIITKSNLSARDRSLCETYLKSKVQVLQV